MRYRPLLALILVIFPALYALAESELAPREDAPVHPFLPIAEVLRNPRCLNCHVSGDTPKQTDARRLHIPNVKGGPDGKGAGMKCATCHREKPGVVPGAPGWRLAPPQMAWEGLSDADLCRTLTDLTKNGGKDPTAIAQHILSDELVAYGWNPGGKRSPVPVSKEELATILQYWVFAGAPCPSN